MVTIEGAMTVQRAAELRDILVDAIARADRLAIDLSGVTSMDLCGLQLLCSAQRTAALRGKCLTLAMPVPDVVRRAAEDAGVCVLSGCGAEDPGRCPWKGETER